MHPVIQDGLEDYLSGTMDPRSQVQFDTHLAVCAACREQVEGMRQISSLFAVLRPESLEAPAPSASFYARVSQQIDLEQSSSIWSALLQPAFARRVAFGYGRFHDRPHRLSRHPVEYIKNALLGRDGDASDRAAVHRDVGEDRRGGKVEVPDGMMHDLVMPFFRAGAEVETDDALAVEVVPRSMASVVVARWRFDGEVHESELLVHGHLRPHARVAGVVG